MKKAYIFDYDFTLGNTSGGIIKSVRYALENMSENIPDDNAIRRTIGLSLTETYKRLTGNTSPERAKQFHDLFVEEADRVMSASAEWLPYAHECLAKLKANGAFIAVCTTKFSRRIREILSLSGDSALVDMIVGGDDVKNQKPAPDGILKIAEESGFPKEDILYVGDSLTDAEAAERAGVAFAAVTTGTTSAEEFSAFPNVGIMSDLRKLEQL